MKTDYMRIAIDIALDTVRKSQEEYRSYVASEIRDEHSSSKKRNWAEDIADSLVLEEPYYDPHAQKVVGKVYMPIDSGDGNYVRAMVLATGNQSGGALYTKPGQPTWNGNIDEYRVHVPPDESPKKLPDQFNFPSGDNFMENAVKLYREHYNENVSAARKKIKDEMEKML